MKNDTDRKTFKLKNPKKREKGNESNSSRESLEMEIRSYKNNKKIQRKKTGEGEEIKFFFNEPTVDKKNKLSRFNNNTPTISSNRTNPNPILNINTKNESNFKDILLHYVNSPENHTKKRIEEKVDKRNSVIYGNPMTILTLNGDESSNNSEKNDDNNSEKSSNSKNLESKSNSSSVSKSKSNSSSEEQSSSEKKSNKKSNKLEEKNKDKSKVSKESSSKINTSKYDDSMKIFSNSNHSKKINDSENEENEKNETNEINNNEVIIIEEKENERVNKQIIPNENDNKKIKSFESTFQKSNKDSSINSNKNYHKIISLNSDPLTTRTNTNTNTQNTHKTQNTFNSSYNSLKINSNKIINNYLYLNDLSFKQQIKIKNRSNSIKNIITIKDLTKENFIKDENTSIMLYKLKNLNISLDIEKSYSYHFKYLTNLQKQKSHYRSNSSRNIYDLNNKNKKINENIENNIFYPNEYYINKNNNLHQKFHISNLFDKLRELKKK